MSNVPKSILEKLDVKLHKKQNHPIAIIKNVIYEWFKDNFNNEFKTFDDENNIVTIVNNFDLLLIPKDHVSRKKTDTYYIDEQHVLRTHTSAHQNELISKGYKSFLVTGDVYRKDEIDRFHYPVFHQMEGVRIIENTSLEYVDNDLKTTIGKLVEYIFPNRQYRFNKDYFPFTDPSYEVEVHFDELDKWVEILGCGVIQRQILTQNNIPETSYGWAFGFGLERYAMLLFKIPDIRLFWSDDERFISQFIDGEKLWRTIEFKQYPKLESIKRDISFWLDKQSVIINDINNINNFEWIKLNDFYELIRETFGDQIEVCNLSDRFYQKKTDRYSHTFSLIFSPNNDDKDGGKFAAETNKKMEIFRTLIAERFNVELR